jgi:hypothetical protein
MTGISIGLDCYMDGIGGRFTRIKTTEGIFHSGVDSNRHELESAKKYEGLPIRAMTYVFERFEEPRPPKPKPTFYPDDWKDYVEKNGFVELGGTI